MIKSASIGELIDVPMRASFPIAFKTSWTPAQAATHESVLFRAIDPDGIQTAFEGEIVVTGTLVEVVLQVTPTMLYKAGTWGIRPEVAFPDDDIRTPDFSLAVNVVDWTSVRYWRKSTLYGAQ